MPQSTTLGVIPNATGANVRADVNDGEQALASHSSGTSAPSPTYAWMDWIDTTNSLWKRRNAGNTAWEIVQNFGATADPTVNDDSGDGYVQGSLWYNTSAKSVFICRNPAAAAAVWDDITDPDILRADVADTLSVGFDVSAYDAGTKSSGTFIPDPADGNFQHAVNGGAHALSPPASDCSIVIQYTNTASAGAVTPSGFAKADLSALTSADGDDFLLFVTRCNGFAHVIAAALQ